MNGRYNLAETPEARIAIAVIAGTHEYFRQNPNGVSPGATFLAEWLKPFIELEEMDIRMDELHRIQSEKIRTRERQLLEQRAELVRSCQARVNGSGG